jgi:hypothetical protein
MLAGGEEVAELATGAELAAAGASSSGRGVRLSGAEPARFAIGLVEGPKSGVETAALDPWSATPRKLPLPVIAAGRLFAVEPAAHAGGVVDADATAVPRESGCFEVRPGGGTLVPGAGGIVTDGGGVVPDGCHAGAGDEGNGWL